MQVNPYVDSCARMIHQKALKTYNRISPEHRRWIDLEDVIQDGVVEAWQASQRYKKRFGTKYSTYLFRGLDLLFSGRYTTPLRQEKRIGALHELDAPLPGNGQSFELAAQQASPEQLFEAVSGWIRVCCAISPRALSFLLRFVTQETGKLIRGHAKLPTGEYLGRNIEDISLIPEACQRFGVGRFELALVMASNYTRGLLVEGVVNSKARLSEDDTNVLECVECHGHFSLNDARRGRYWASSLTCLTCLRKLHGQGNTCFGRLKVIDKGRTVREGFSEHDDECRMHCRDRVACKRFIELRERKRMAESVDNLQLDGDVFDVEDVGDAEPEFNEDVEEELGEAEVEEVEEPEPEPVTPAKVPKPVAAKPAKAVKPVAAKPVAKASAKVAAKAAKPVAAKPVKKIAKPVKAAKPVKVVKVAKKVAKPVKVAKLVKAAKPVKKAKAPRRSKKSSAKIDPRTALKQGLITLDEKKRDMPFRPGSVMRYYLEQALEPGGVNVATLEKWATKNGYKHKFQMQVLLSGRSGDSSQRPYPTTHTWKIEQSKGGKVRAYDLKRVAFYERMDRV